MKKLTIFLMVIVLFGCNKSDDVKPSEPWNVDNGIEFSVFNADNEDLLDPSTANHLTASEIKLFYVVDGKVEEVFGNYRIYQHEHEYRIAMGLNFSADTCITYVQWVPNIRDTLKAAYVVRNENAVIESKIWLNGIQIWELSEGGGPYYKLIK